MRTRIIKQHGYYYPQYKGWGFWRNFKEGRYGHETIKCSTLEAAREFIKQEKKRQQAESDKYIDDGKIYDDDESKKVLTTQTDEDIYEEIMD